MMETLTRIFRETKNETYLTAAVKKRWITADQKKKIMEAK